MASRYAKQVVKRQTIKQALQAAAGEQDKMLIMKRVFMIHDEDRDGRLSRSDLTEAFRYLGAWFPSCRAFLALRHADTNGDGYISDYELDQLVHYAFKCGFANSSSNYEF